MSNETVNILLFLAQGFEDLEAISIIDVFGWTWYRNRQAIVQNKSLYDKSIMLIICLTLKTINFIFRHITK